MGSGDTRELQVCCHTQQCDHSLIFDENFLGRTISLNLLHLQTCVRQGFRCVSQLPNLRKCHPLDTFGWISSEIGGQKSNVYLLLAISSRCRARWNHVLKVPYGLFANFNFAETDKLPVTFLRRLVVQMELKTIQTLTLLTFPPVLLQNAVSLVQYLSGPQVEVVAINN